MFKVLAVDDSPTVLAGIKLALERKGYEIYTLQRAEEALEQLEAQKVDLIFTDLNMPGIDGLEFIRLVRGRNTANRFTPIVMLTTESQQAKKEEARKAGATAWITKPFTAEELEYVIKKLLR